MKSTRRKRSHTITTTKKKKNYDLASLRNARTIHPGALIGCSVVEKTPLSLIPSIVHHKF
jgi:hypothetical protein